MVKFITLVILHAHLYQLPAHDRILLLLHNSSQLLLTLPALHSKNSLFFHHQVTIPLNAHLRWTIKDQARQLEQLMTLQLNNESPNKVQFYDGRGTLAATLYLSIQHKSFITTLEPLDLIVNRLRSHQVHKSNSYLVRVSYGQSAFFTSSKFSDEAVVHWKEKYGVQRGRHKYLFVSVWQVQEEKKTFKAWGNISFDQMEQRQSLNVQLQLKGENGAFGSLWIELIRKQEDRLLKLYLVEVLPQQWTFPQELYFIRIKVKNQKFDSRNYQARPDSLQLQQEIKVFLTDSQLLQFQLIQFARQRVICAASISLHQLQSDPSSPIQISLQSKQLRSCKLYMHLGKSLNRVRNKITREAQRVERVKEQVEPFQQKLSDVYKYSFTFQEYKQEQSLSNAIVKPKLVEQSVKSIHSQLQQQTSNHTPVPISFNQTPFKQKLPLIPQRSAGNFIKPSAVQKRAKSNNERTKPKYVYREDSSSKPLRQIILQQTLSKRPDLLEKPGNKPPPDKHSIAVNTIQVLERNLRVDEHRHRLADHRSMVNVIQRVNIHPFKKDRSISLNPILKANVFPSQTRQRPASRPLGQEWYQMPIERRKYEKEPALMIDLITDRVIKSQIKQLQEKKRKQVENDQEFDKEDSQQQEQKGKKEVCTNQVEPSNNQYKQSREGLLNQTSKNNTSRQLARYSRQKGISQGQQSSKSQIQQQVGYNDIPTQGKPLLQKQDQKKETEEDQVEQEQLWDEEQYAPVAKVSSGNASAWEQQPIRAQQLDIVQLKNTLFETFTRKIQQEEFKVVATAKLKPISQIDRIQVSAQVLQALKEGLEAMWESKTRNQREFMGLFLRRWSSKSQ